MSGQKIIDGLREAVAGTLARVTIDGQTWVREPNPDSALRQALVAAEKHLAQALRQWRMYADMHDDEGERGLATAETTEGELFREGERAHALITEALQRGEK